jgi:hypothetical protein
MPEALLSAPGPLGAPIVRVTLAPLITISTPGPLGPELVTAATSRAWIQVDSPLDPQNVLAYHDFTVLLPDSYPSRYEMQLTTPSGPVRVPISSWQATLQKDLSSYVQCVVPGVDQWVDHIDVATRFDIFRIVEVGGTVTEYGMASADLELAQYDQGARRYTCVISGHSEAYTSAPDPAYDRTLTGVRSITTDSGGVRVRCDIDFLLRPGQTAAADDVVFEVSYINYYVNRADAYMDVGERV